ncbi:glucosamine-6-phosphate deaminase [Lacisediminihabitans changchengi]|uniref:Glucosamine-6-phosphate deaminase n=1 Tax=Lacisediminihabitans changchengi TaxID=2787634 RepID=A0A934W5B0_9MICO|nr:glucosamine-6-phosphate deaminase [Lacisediminihabitans changchengi]MBK4348300.1 glucosamine-6-phosphate deaminase [Lacisediminihabitans changchengi]
MEIIILPTSAEVGRTAAAHIASLVSRDPSAVLGLATGSSPLGIYAELARGVELGLIDFGQARAFALDEYVGIPLDHEQSYATVIRTEVVEPLRMNASLVQVPDGRAADIEAACDRYEADIVEAGGIDLQILGIGSNGHIGFNEPTSSFASRTRIKTLAPQTRDDNARFFASLDEVPSHCVTQGLGTIMAARHVLLVAQGAKKADAVAAAIEGPVSSLVPASILQHHPHATIVIDEEAASALTLADYYRYVYEHKPHWQRVPPLPY